MKADDVFSFSSIAYEILAGKRIKSASDCSFEDDNISKAWRDLIEKCRSTNPNDRPTFSEIAGQLKESKQLTIEKVNQNDIDNYVSLLDKYQIKCDSQEISEKPQFKKISSDVQNKVKEVDDDNQQLNENFLDLTKFELGDLISKSDFSKMYKVISTKNHRTYSCKISTIEMSKLSRDELINLSREVNIISQLIHPSFLKFVGYSPVDFKGKNRPVIVTDLAANGTLSHILECERNSQEIPGWDETKKLIIIFGIASGMSYLHSNSILHRDLRPENVYLDEYLFPKIGDFGLSTKSHNIESMTLQSSSGVKGSPEYSAPEVLQSNGYSKSSDVYAFAMIVYEIVTGNVPFGKISRTNQVFNEVVKKCSRPEISESVPRCFRELIENCWSQDPSERPSFDDIVEILRKDDRFITQSVRKDDFIGYIAFIDESRKAFDSSQRILNLDEFIKEKSKIVEQ